MLLGADSEDAIRVTHPTYFRDFEAEPFSMEEFESPALAGSRAHIDWMNGIAKKAACWLLRR